MRLHEPPPHQCSFISSEASDAARVYGLWQVTLIRKVYISFLDAKVNNVMWRSAGDFVVILHHDGDIYKCIPIDHVHLCSRTVLETVTCSSDRQEEEATETPR